MGKYSKIFTSYISCFCVLYVSCVTFFPTRSYANSSCTSEMRASIEPSCKAYQEFDVTLCNCKDKEGHDQETRNNLQEGFEGCIEDDNSQECYESLAASASGLNGDCDGKGENEGIGGSNSFKTSSNVTVDSSIVSKRDDNGDIVPPGKALCADFDGMNGLTKTANIIRGMYIAVSIFMYYGFKNKGKLAMVNCFGSVAFIAANIASLVTEIVIWILNKDKLTNLLDEYEESTKCKVDGETNTDCNPLDPMEAQTKAFDFIIEERRVLSSMAFSKYIQYLINSVLMVLSGALLLTQAILTGTGQTLSCSLPPATVLFDNENNQNKVPSKFEEFIKNLLLKQVAPDQAIAKEKTGDLGDIIGDLFSLKDDETAVKTMPYVGHLVIGLGAGALVAGIATLGVGNPLDAFIKGTGGVVTSSILAVVSLVLGGFYGILGFQYRDYANAAENQANQVASMKDAILEQIEIICPSGRNDPSDTRCFCFDETGGRRSDRRNSETCQALFSALDAKITLTSGDLALSQNVQRKCCVALDGNIDCDCNCQKLKNKQTGENACLKAVIPPAQLNSLGSIPGVGDGLNQLASATGASSSSGNVNADNLQKNAKTLLNSARQILKQSNDKQIKQGKKPFPTQSLTPFLRTADQLAAKIQTASLPLSPSSTPTNKVKGNKALASVKTKLKKKGFQFVGGGRSLKRKSKKKKKDDEFGFAFDNAEGQAQGETETFMDKKYNYKEDDIYKNKSVSLWKILSNRYNTSGYLRLFDEGESK